MKSVFIILWRRWIEPVVSTVKFLCKMERVGWVCRNEDIIPELMLIFISINWWIKQPSQWWRKMLPLQACKGPVVFGIVKLLTSSYKQKESLLVVSTIAWKWNQQSPLKCFKLRHLWHTVQVKPFTFRFYLNINGQETKSSQSHNSTLA